MNTYDVRREVLYYEFCTIKADSEEEAIEKIKSYGFHEPENVYHRDMLKPYNDTIEVVKLFEEETKENINDEIEKYKTDLEEMLNDTTEKRES